MAIFPSDDLALDAATRARIRPQESSYAPGRVENVKRNSPQAGSSQARDMWGAEKWTASMEFILLDADIELLWSFWRKNRVSGFYMFDFKPKTIGTPNGLYGYDDPIILGTSNGSPQTFTLPAKEVSNLQVYSNGVAIGSALSVGTGSMGEDKVTATGTNGEQLTAALRGRFRYFCEIPEVPKVVTVSYARQSMTMTALEKF